MSFEFNPIHAIARWSLAVVGDDALPAGMVTFCFTDIEGSTSLFERLGDRWPSLLDEHRRLQRAALTACGGIEVKSTGDGLFVVFADAARAVDGAVGVQRAVEGHAWPPGVVCRVRIGLHTGPGQPIAGDYTSLAAHEAARVAAAGHGGEILLSGSMAEQVAGTLPPGVSLRPLGSYWLGGLERPRHLVQVCADDLPNDFPPLRARRAARHNVPVMTSGLIGRGADLAALHALLDEHRVVTLLGPGGVGKTRLAIEEARHRAGVTDGGAWLVELAPLRPGPLVADAVARAIGARLGDEDPAVALVEHIGTEDVLLALDNCEHVIGDVGVLVRAIVAHCPGARILATSRRPLGVPSERPFRLGALDPDAACDLFITRAAEARPSLASDAQQLDAIATICARLDRLPLAIELAAARMAAMSATELAERLDERFGLIRSTSRSGSPRHRDLEALVAWSYDLLDDRAQRVFARLAVFAGGWALDAAEHVCAGAVDRSEVVDALSSLVDASIVLIESAHGATRFRMLETIRERAAVRLRAMDEEARDARARHFAWFLALAEAADAENAGPRISPALDSLDAELDNLRAALAYAIELGDSERGLRLGTALGRFWDLRGHFAEGRSTLAALLALPAEPSELRATALFAAGRLALRQGDLRAAEGLARESLTMADVAGSRRVASMARNGLGIVANIRGDIAAAEAAWIDAIELAGGIDAPELVAGPTHNLGRLAMSAGQFDRAEALVAKASALDRGVGNARGVAEGLDLTIELAFHRGDFASARSTCEEAIAVWRQLGGISRVGMCCEWLARIAFEQGNDTLAEQMAAESHAIAVEFGNTAGQAWAAAAAAEVALAAGDTDRASSLLDEALAGALASEEADCRARVMLLQGVVARRTGDRDLAVALFAKTARAAWAAGLLVPTVSALDELAALASADGRPDLATRLSGAASATRSQLGLPMPRTHRSAPGVQTAGGAPTSPDLTEAVALAQTLVGALNSPTGSPIA